MRNRHYSPARYGFLTWMAGREPLAPVGAVLAWTGLALAITVPILLALPVGPLVKTLATLTFVCFGTGSGLLCRIRLGSAVVTWALVLVLSVSVFALPAAVMVWTAHWYPVGAFYALDAITVLAALWGLAPAFLANTATGRRAAARRRLRAEWLLQAHAFDPMSMTRVMEPIRDDSPGTVAAQTTPIGGGGGPEAAGAASATENVAASALTIPLSARRDVLNVRLPHQGGDANPEHGVAGTGASESRSESSGSTEFEAGETAVIRLPDGIFAEDASASPVHGAAGPADETHLLPALRSIDDTVVMQIWRDVAQVRAEHSTDESGATRSRRPRDRVTATAWAVGHIAGIGWARLNWQIVVQVGLLATATALWIASLVLSTTAGVGEFGLLSVMHPTFFAGLALCVGGFMAEIVRGARRTWLLVANLVLLLLIMHATVPILVREPEYAWTYKHIGVIDLFRTTGHIVNYSDIYQAWPTFFAAVASLVTVSGASTLRLAAWGPLFFDAANCLPLYAVVRTLTNDRRLPFLTVFVFTGVNWVAQDYLSPQAFVYVLCLGGVLVMVRWLRRPAGPIRVRPRMLARLWERLQEGLTAVPYVGRRTEWIALGCLYLIDAVVVISHQLSPYMMALSAIALVMLGLIRTWQVAPILVAIPVLYLLPNYQVADHYGIFDGLDIFRNLFHSTQGVSPTTSVSSHGQVFSAAVVQLLSLVLWGLAAISVVSERRRVAPVALPAVLAFGPFAMLLEQSYGGEVIYRVYLFSAPWSVYLACRLAVRLWRRVPAVAATVSASLAITVAALVGIQGEHGQLTFDQFSTDEVAAAQYVYANAPAGSIIVAAEGNLPTRLSRRYVDFNGGADPITFGSVLSPAAATVTPQEMQKIDEFCSGFQSPVYVLITNSMTNYANYFGYLPDGKLANLRVAMSQSAYWKPVFVTPDAIVYQFDV